MEIKELKALLKLLRDQGVLQYQTAELNLVLAENAPIKERYSSAATELVGEEELSPEEEAERLLFYSATPPPTEPQQ
jgi:hypothetical protein